MNIYLKVYTTAKYVVKHVIIHSSVSNAFHEIIETIFFSKLLHVFKQKV